MTHATLVSVGLAVYNGQDLVGRTLEALLDQDHRNLEVVVCDDASTDGTAAICQAFAARDPRVRYLRNPQNLGPWGNMLHTLSLAKGDYFFWAPHDDVHERQFVSTLAGELDAHPEAVAAFCTLGIMTYDGKKVRDQYADMPPSLMALGRPGLYRLWFASESKPDGTLSSALFRRSVLVDGVRFLQMDPKLQSGFDGLLPLYAVGVGDFRFRKKCLYTRRLKQEQPMRAPVAAGAVRRRAGFLHRLMHVGTIAARAVRNYYPIYRAVRRLVPLRSLPLPERIFVERRHAYWFAWKVVQVCRFYTRWSPWLRPPSPGDKS